MERNQEQRSRIMTTMGSEKAYSPVWPSIKSMGRNAKIVVREEVSKGIARVFPASIQAWRLSSPRSKRPRISSATTMPLSTSIPNAIIADAMETRSSSTPKKPMTISPSNMVMGTKEPTMRPVRTPRKSITTISTITKVW